MNPSRDFRSRISGELIDISLTERGGPQAYNALSYSWGPTFTDDSHLTEWILCSGRALRITHGLQTALRYIREYEYRADAHLMAPEGTIYSSDIGIYRHFAKRPLWIDAVCINRADLNERAQQVKVMATIYQIGRAHV